MNRDEFADHLQELRAQLTGRYEEAYSMLGTDLTERRPPPAGDIEVVERSWSTGDGEEWTVQFSWRAGEPEAEEEDAGGG